MRRALRYLSCFGVLLAVLTDALPCGPSYITPLFVNSSAPENPYENFAAGKLGIIKPEMNRSVLFAAYRYLNGGGFTADEQKAMVDVWNADFNNRDFGDLDISEALKAWIAKRAEEVGKEDKTPAIYSERSYGGYDFFPNCARNAFEVATQTLTDRAGTYGSDSKEVRNWIDAQDKVFANCSTSSQVPDEAPPGSPAWLQKDRAYQIAAAAFYSMDFENAKRRFNDIALDFESPWQETAAYLVIRTLVRQGSFAGTPAKAAEYYAEAEDRLSRFTSGSSKFNDSADRMVALIKYRIHPKERAAELARKLAFESGNTNLRQDLIDYTWLLDRFEKEALEAEDKRVEEAKKREEAGSGTAAPAATPQSSTEWEDRYEQQRRGETFSFYISTPSSDAAGAANISNVASSSQTFTFNANRSIESVREEVERSIGRKLTPDEVTRLNEAKQESYHARTTYKALPDYDGGYFGSQKATLVLVPSGLRADELTDWLFTFQINDSDAYDHALAMYRRTNSQLWLTTALVKAAPRSTDLPLLVNAAKRVGKLSPAYPTIAYHLARIYIAQNNNEDARGAIDDALASPDLLTVAGLNEFTQLRKKLTSSLDDYLRYSLLKPYAFDLDGQTGTIDEFIAQQKRWYDPEYHKEGREAYEQEIDKQYADERLWQDRLMFDSGTINSMNRYFPLSVLIDVERSQVVPDYLRERFATAIWTRSVLLGDTATAQKMAPEVVRLHPELEQLMDRVTKASTPAARNDAILFLILKNPMLTPYVEDGLGRTDNEFGNFDANDWWCQPYEGDYGEEVLDGSQASQPVKPAFLTPLQAKAAQAEKDRLQAVGDAPKFLGEQVLNWFRRSPTDPRIPEALYIAASANGWTKYGCGSNEELHGQLASILKRRFPSSEWLKKLNEDENGN